MMKITEDDLADWLRLLLVDGLGSMTAQKLLRAFGLPYNILKQSHGTLVGITSDRIATDLRASPSEAFQKQMELICKIGNDSAKPETRSAIRMNAVNRAMSELMDRIGERRGSLKPQPNQTSNT